MSYILDALRRADSERERGAVPGLHAQSMSADPGDPRARPWWGQPWAWVTAGLCGGLLVAGGLRWLWSDPVPGPVLQAAAPMPLPPVPAPVSAPVPAPAVPQAPGVPPPVAQVPLPPAPAPVPAPSPAPVAPTYAPPLGQTPPPANRTPVFNAPPIESRKPVTTPATAVAGPDAAEPNGDNKVYTLNELPGDVRSQLPQLSIGGSSYSEHGPSRLLILNGQVFREGDRITGDLTLEQIQLKSAVLRFKTYRYRLTY